MVFLDLEIQFFVDRIFYGCISQTCFLGCGFGLPVFQIWIFKTGVDDFNNTKIEWMQQVK